MSRCIDSKYKHKNAQYYKGNYAKKGKTVIPNNIETYA